MRSNAEPLTSRIILVVHEEAERLAEAKRFLTDSDYRVLTARSASEALTCIHESDPDLMVVDARVPRMRAVLMARRFHGRTQRPIPPVVFVGVSGSAEQLQWNFQSGVLFPVLGDVGLERWPQLLESAFERLEFEHDLD